MQQESTNRNHLFQTVFLIQLNNRTYIKQNAEQHNILSEYRIKSISFDFSVNFVRPINECTLHVSKLNHRCYTL